MNHIGVLFVDDEENALKAFRRVFKDDYEVYTARSAAEALHTLEEDPDRISVVISDQRMPQRSGISMLSEVRKRYPEKIRLLTTAYTEIDTLTDAINVGAVYRFISKPWDLVKLRQEIEAAIQSFASTNHNKELLAHRIEELKQAVLDEKVMEIGTVAVNLSHYVDNALCPVDLLISKIESDLTRTDCQLGDVERRATYLDFLKRIRVHIRSTCSQISRLHQAHQALSSETLATVDLGSLCEEAVEANQVLIESKNIHLHRVVDRAHCRIRGESDRLRDFFNFLLAEEVVSLPNASSAEIRIGPSLEGDFVRVTLEDRNPLPGKVSPSHLLYPFNVRSGDPRQLGVFLICAYFIARSHGGKMVAQEYDGGGVSFAFDFPVNGPDNKSIMSS